jgi:hypothetical protein
MDIKTEKTKMFHGGHLRFFLTKSFLSVTIKEKIYYSFPKTPSAFLQGFPQLTSASVRIESGWKYPLHEQSQFGHNLYRSGSYLYSIMLSQTKNGGIL